jgi:hypothetical protein
VCERRMKETAHHLDVHMEATLEFGRRRCIDRPKQL